MLNEGCPFSFLEKDTPRSTANCLQLAVRYETVTTTWIDFQDYIPFTEGLDLMNGLDYGEVSPV